MSSQVPNLLNPHFTKEKPYYALDTYLREQFGEKVYRISLNAGLSCPNRDGTLGTRGCIFCSQGGSGDFAGSPVLSISQQLEAAREPLVQKRNCHKFIAYFQAYTNTYGSVEHLRELYNQAIAHPDVVVLAIATRPDCLSPEIVELLLACSQKMPVWVELGLQTMHDKTRDFLRSGFSLADFSEKVQLLRSHGIPVITHVILGLPGESRDAMLQTIDYLADLGIDGIKLQLLHILSDTDLYNFYQSHPFPLLSQEEYCELVAECLEHLPPEVVIHRLTGDGPGPLLIAPQWSRRKRQVLNEIHRHLRQHHSYQGKQYQKK